LFYTGVYNIEKGGLQCIGLEKLELKNMLKMYRLLGLSKVV